MIRALCRSIHQDHKSNIAYLLILLCNVLIEQAIEGDFQRPSLSRIVLLPRKKNSVNELKQITDKEKPIS